MLGRFFLPKGFFKTIAILSLLMLPAAASAQTLAFIDGEGQVTSTVLETTAATLRVEDAAANIDPGFAEEVVVSLSTQVSGDAEVVYLRETGDDTGVFEGSIDLALGDPPSQFGVLETSTDFGPPFSRDTIDADYATGTATASADLVGSITVFIDAFGQPTSSAAVLDQARVRVIDPEADGDPAAFDTTTVTLTALGSGDSELVQFSETGIATGTFEGSVAIGPGSLPDDGALDATFGETIEARHTHLVHPDESVGQATLVGSLTTLVAADGEPATELLEHTEARVRVVDHGANVDAFTADVTSSQMQALLSGDSESISLTETGLDTGVFEGGLPLDSSLVVIGNGWLETTQDPGPPVAFDTVVATHTDAFGQSSDSVSTLGARLELLDAFGNAASTYPTGSRVYLRVEDHDAIDYAFVSVTTSGGDVEEVFLSATEIGSRVFEGFIELQDLSPPTSYDTTLQALVGEQFTASYADVFGYSVPSATATIVAEQLDFIDATGAPTDELLEGGTARLRLFSDFDNIDPASIETVVISLGTFAADDSEDLVLTETDIDSSTFEGSIPLATSSPGVLQNGIVELVNLGPPTYAFEKVTAGSNNASAEATVVASRIFFLDAAGRDAEVYPAGDTVYLRVLDNNGNDPQQLDTLLASVVASGSGDSERVLVQETGFDSGVFEGSVDLGAGALPDDGLLDATFGDALTAIYEFLQIPGAAIDQATISGSATFFIDAAGELTSEYLQGGLVFVRVVAHDANVNPTVQEQTTVQLSSLASADTETLTLTETGADSGVFEGSITTERNSGQPGSGVLETTESSGPDPRDTLVATYFDPFGQSSATARTVGSRLSFIDGAGNPASAYPTGGIAFVRVEDQNLNNPGVLEGVNLNLFSNVGDSLDVFLLETDKTSGIYEASVQLADSPTADFFNGTLETQAGGGIQASYTEGSGFSSFAEADITSEAVEIIDAAGLPTAQLLESDVVRVRVASSANNLDPFATETVAITLSSLYAADSESLVLTETGADTAVFEGQMALEWIDPDLGSNTVGNGLLGTSNSFLPSFLGDVVTASFGGASANATTVGLRLVLIDAFGQETESFAESDRAYVRVISHTVNDPLQVDVVDVTVRSLTSGDVEQVLLNETSFDTAVFEGSISLSSLASPSAFDGVLASTTGEEIEAERFAFTGTLPAATDRALIGGSTTFFVDASGELTDEYLQGAPVFVQVIAHEANSSPGVDTTSVALSSEVTGDQEFLTLTETGGDTGVFEGSMPTQRGPSQAGDGVLDTSENISAPDDRDTLFATYSDFFGDSTATARTIGSRIAFLDAAGNATDTYATGGTAYLRVEDQNLNNPGVLEGLNVSLFSSVGDNLDFFLLETEKSSGIYEAAIDLLDSATPETFNGSLETQGEGNISASYTEGSGFSSFTDADITANAVEFFDEAGLPTSELLESHVARVRVTSTGDNLDSFAAETVSVTLSSLYAADSESLVLTETGADTGVFEGTIATQWIDPPVQAGIPGNGVLETENSYIPLSLPDVVTATFGSATAEATTVGLRLVLIDAFGQQTERFAADDVAYVRVISHTVNNPLQIDVVDVTVRSLNSGDVEQVLLSETNFDTAVFEGSISLSSTAGAIAFDGTLAAFTGEEVEAERFAFTGTSPAARDRALIGGSTTFFIDVAGQLAGEYLQGAPVFVRVIAHEANAGPGVDTTSVALSSEVTGDQEFLTLTETGGNTGVFEGSMPTRRGASQAGDGVLDTSENISAPDDRDTLFAIYSDFFGDSTATARTVGSRIAFLDAAGNATDTYATGGTAYLRVEDQNLNNPGVLEGLNVSLFSSVGDNLDFFLLETEKSSGIYEAAIDLADSATPETFNGTLETQGGGNISASYTEGSGFSSFADADITATSVEFFDEAGLPTSEVLENHVARVRVTSVGDNLDSFSAETVSVTLSSLYATDSESLVLTETSADSSVFEGTIATQWIDPPTQAGLVGNGILETENSYLPAFLPDEVTATFGGASATANTVALRLFLIDAFGQDTESFAAGDTAYVRVISHTVNDPLQVDVVDVTVRSLSSGDVEQVLLNETGFDTAVFEGSIGLTSDLGPIQFDGQLSTFTGEEIEAERFPFTGTLPAAVDRALVGGSTTFFIDPAGELTDEYLQGAPVFVRVIAHEANVGPGADTTSVAMSSEVTGDQEFLTLTETGGDTGVFEGSMPTRRGSSQAGDGVLDTSENISAPDDRDTLFATYSDFFGDSIATARTVGSRIAFLDAAGNATDTYATGSTAYLRVEDQNLNNPGVQEGLNVSLFSSVGDNLDFFLLETEKSSGIYEAAIDLLDSATPETFNGSLETQGGGNISASYTEGSGFSSFTDADITANAVGFFDEAGLPTSELLESHVARVRVTSVGDNLDSFAVETVSVSLSSLYAADSESLVLTETSADSSVFEGTIPTQWIDPPTQAGTVGNGVLETENSYLPAFLPDEVTATFGGASATANTVALRLFLIDEFGQDTESYAEGDTVYLRVINHTVNDPLQIDVVDVTVRAPNGDSEQVLLNETGLDTAVYEGSIDLGPGTTFDGRLAAVAGDEIEAERFPFTGTLPAAIDRAAIVGSATFFVDDQGQPAAVYFQGSEAHVKVIAHGVNSDPLSAEVTSVNVAAEITGDSEPLTLTETGADTGVFTGTINLDGGSAFPGDGVLTTGNDPGLPDPFDTLTATYADAFGQSEATARTRGSRTTFIDGLGAEVTTLDNGLTGYLRVEDFAAGNPGQVDFAMASLFSSTGDNLDVFLTETGVDTSVYEGSFELQDSGTVDPFDGLLQAPLGSEVSASYSDSFGPNGSFASALVVTPSNFPPSVDITSPADSSVFVGADLIAFAGTASDPEEGDLSANLEWTSDVDGIIGTGGSFSTNLSIGTHFITASVTDAGGRSSQAGIQIQVDNTAPVTVITAPADGALFTAGDPVDLIATANDFEDGDLTTSIQWFSDVDGNLGTGGTVQTSTLSEGAHVITASVSDSGGLFDDASVNITIEPANTAPTVNILSPAGGASFFSADLIAFSGTASDLEDGDLTTGLVWTSDLDGNLGTGGSVLANLSIGSHVISASVTDIGGLQGSAVVSIEVTNTPPSVTISAPLDGSTFNTGVSIDFAATASDFEDGDLTVNLSWSSDLDGTIGPSGGSFSLSTLSAGTHVITAEVNDSGGLQSSDSITITVNAGPSVTITAPVDGSGFNSGDSVSFTGTASDPEDGDLTASLSWTSDVDGAIGTGGSFSTSSLSVGSHVITATVSDSGGLQSSEAITITVNGGPSVTITAP
ncbi:MAG: hypothetical protein AAF657_07780, partial [Acidobacteriota bacterium]